MPPRGVTFPNVDMTLVGTSGKEAPLFHLLPGQISRQGLSLISSHCCAYTQRAHCTHRCTTGAQVHAWWHTG